jgi:ribonuclease HII
MFVGVVLVDASTKRVPAGTRDSKMLTGNARQDLSPLLSTWCVAWAIGEVSAAEIDEHGLTRSLGIAARRALDALPSPPTCLIVDGNSDFVTPKDQVSALPACRPGMEVRPVVRADVKCGSVAAASVLAKVARDDVMVGLAGQHPAYGFDQHKGYGTLEHAAAIAEHGLTGLHRRSWTFAERIVPHLDGEHASWEDRHDEEAHDAPSRNSEKRATRGRELDVGRNT